MKAEVRQCDALCDALTGSCLFSAWDKAEGTFVPDPVEDAGCLSHVSFAFRAVVGLAHDQTDCLEILPLCFDERGSTLVAVPRHEEGDLETLLESLADLSSGRWPGRDHLLISLAPALFAAGLGSPGAAATLARLRARGCSLTVLLGGSSSEAMTLPLGDAMNWWRRAGCGIGVDEFGYAMVPALWPLAHGVDLVRIDGRLLNMQASGVISLEPVAALVRLVKSMGVERVVVDGCSTHEQVACVSNEGATHGQGVLFGGARQSLAGLL